MKATSRPEIVTAGQPMSLQGNMLLPTIAAFGLSFLAYIFTLAPTISWKNGSEDSGELAVAAYYLGIAHPTGYPLYVLLGKLFTLLPLGDVAFRLNLMSAFFAASAVATATLATWCLLVGELKARKGVASFAALVGGLLYAFSPALWSQAVIIEVYPLHILLASLVVFILFWSLYYVPSAGLGHFVALAFLCGLGLAHHLTIVLLFPGVAFLVLASKIRRLLFSPRGAMAGATAFSLGLAPYLLFLVRSNRSPEANWGAIDSLWTFFSHVTGAAYRPLLLSGTDPGVLLRVASAARLLLEQYGWLGFAAAVVGLWYLAQTNRRLLLFWAFSALPVLAFSVNYSARDSQVYFLPLYLFVAIAIAIGIAFAATALWDSLPLFVILPRRWQADLSRWYMPTVLLAGAGWVLWSAAVTTPKVNSRGDTEAYEYALTTLDALPQSSVILTNDDSQSFSLWYLQYVVGYRRDVVVADTRLLSWPWYRKNLASLYPEIKQKEPQGTIVERIQQFITDNRDERPIYSAFTAPYLASGGQEPPFRVDQ